MNIQHYIDRKREAGAKEHEGNSTDWAGWTQGQYFAAIAGELLDAMAYAQQAKSVAKLQRNIDLAKFLSDEIYNILAEFNFTTLEAACREAEATDE